MGRNFFTVQFRRYLLHLILQKHCALCYEGNRCNCAQRASGQLCPLQTCHLHLSVFWNLVGGATLILLKSQISGSSFISSSLSPSISSANRTDSISKIYHDLPFFSSCNINPFLIFAKNKLPQNFSCMKKLFFFFLMPTDFVAQEFWQSATERGWKIKPSEGAFTGIDAGWGLAVPVFSPFESLHVVSLHKTIWAFLPHSDWLPMESVPQRETARRKLYPFYCLASTVTPSLLSYSSILRSHKPLFNSSGGNTEAGSWKQECKILECTILHTWIPIISF